MFAVTGVGSDPVDPLRHLRFDERPIPRPAPGWTTVTVRATSLNRHDLWMLQGSRRQVHDGPRVLGSDAAGIDNHGVEVIVLPVIGDPRAGDGDETLDPDRGILGDDRDGTFAQHVTVPTRNLVTKPPSLSWEYAACLPGAWLTAYRMLFDRVDLPEAARVLVQGAGGGVATALITLGSAAGHRMWVTSRSAERRRRALRLGAEAVFEPDARLPDRVDAVMETVGAATWTHSLRAVRSGGHIVVSGATSGLEASTHLGHVFFRQIHITGSTLGTRAHLVDLVRFVTRHGLRPAIDRVTPLADARAGFRALLDGEVFGKVVFVP
ncbi:zinc-binding dehydrogenase [Streptomyces sp. NPDC047097]|uniref:zinc-binding dehydrogenase n=1 Tax=Streptomyces sp. NPDC047097 TaxID=3155260 RepID=UPI0033C16D32